MAKGWTIDTLKEHFEALRKDDQIAVASALSAADRAAAKADLAMEKRFDGVNEFRAQLGDQASTLMPRAESAAQFDAMNARVTALTGQLTKLEAKGEGKREGIGGTGATIFQVIIGLAAIVAMIGTMVTFFSGTRALPVSNPVTYQQPAEVAVPILAAPKP
jgi:hypothetical protein